MPRLALVVTLLMCLVSPLIVRGQTTRPAYADAAGTPVLPPLIPWDGASRRLAVGADDRWATPCEKSGFRLSPGYDETVAWLKRLEAAAPSKLRMVSLGRSPEGREIWMVIASRNGAATPEALRGNGKPTFLAQAGIHSGEIDGKDAGMMLLRDMTVRGTKAELLEGANFLFVPIFSVDGHERASAYTRSNQRGPEIAGWRTTSRNLNLNRDYVKADSLEMRAMIRALVEWDPDLYYDIHVTDGADYQYDITWGCNGEYAQSPAINSFLRTTFTPMLEAPMREQGHTPGPLVFAKDAMELEKGIEDKSFEPRYSHGYGDARHIPSFLIENHALKPFDRRVLGTYVLLESTMRALASHGEQLREAVRTDRGARRAVVPLDFTTPPADAAVDRIDFLGVEYRLVPSPISGGLRVEWLGSPKTYRLPRTQTSAVSVSAPRARAYWIPPAWTEVVERLKLHGVEFETFDAPREMDVTMYRIEDPKVSPIAFEGRVPLFGRPVAERRRERFAAGSVRVSTDQPLGDLVTLMLEPASPDSFFQWGFFTEILQRTEYIDGYILEPMAERMMAADPALAEAFRRKLADDKDFAASPARRLEWFYTKTPFYDERWRLYPVAREEAGG